jgi:hypothetical protein
VEKKNGRGRRKVDGEQEEGAPVVESGLFFLRESRKLEEDESRRRHDEDGVFFRRHEQQDENDDDDADEEEDDGWSEVGEEDSRGSLLADSLERRRHPFFSELVG